jgi:SAM-dependent methyltransferase
VGTDADSKLLQAAQVYVQREGLTDIELRQGDATQTDFPDASFDLVHTRFLFPHVEKPEALLREMIRLAKPGGIIAVQEPDHSSWNFYPPCAEWPEFLDLLERTLAIRGDINIGRQMYKMLREAGLKEVSVRAGVVALQNKHPYMAMPIVAAQAMRTHMIAAGLMAEKRLNALIEAVTRCVQDEARMQVTFTVIQVWGQKS